MKQEIKKKNPTYSLGLKSFVNKGEMGLGATSIMQLDKFMQSVKCLVPLKQYLCN